MENKILKATECTPNIIFKPFEEIFEISGESRPEDARIFFSEIIDWLNMYFSVFFSETDLVKRKTGMILIFKMEYFNSTSAKFFLDILMLLDQYYSNGFDIKIKWYYKSGDNDIQESGEELSKFVKLPFNIMEITDDLLIEATKTKPSVTMRPKDNIYEISGMSYPEEGVFFYQPVIEWIDTNGKKYFNSDTVFNFRIGYFNTSSAKMFLAIFKKLDVFYLKSLLKKINWYYDDEDDTDLQELIDDYSELVSIPIKLIYKDAK